MKSTAFSRNGYAVSEVIGAMLLVVIAVGAFAVIYSQVFPVKLPGPEPHIELAGYVTSNGTVVLEHIGGAPLSSYKFRIEHKNGTITMSPIENQPIQIGDHLPINETLNETNNLIKITVWNIGQDGSEQTVFDGIITPKNFPPGPTPQPLPDPMFISTLRTDTVDEDLICYSYSIYPNIQPPLTYIYNWMSATTGAFHSLTRLLMPFDTQNPFFTKDYSGNNNNGTITGATWTPTGKLGGAYQFNGDDFITIPYCFENNKIDKITIEAWVKTNKTSGTIVSYDRNNYCELAMVGGRVKWSTNSSDGVIDVIGARLVDDNTWHFVAATYNSSMGVCSIYVDGKLDTTKNAHATSKLLGSGNSAAGAIGKGTGLASRKTVFFTGFETQSEKNTWTEQNSTGGQTANWTTLRYDNFNSGWGSYIPGSNGSLADCYRSTTHHEGTYSTCIRDRSGTASSFKLTNSIDMDTPSYKSLKIDFWWMWNGNGWTTGKDFWILYYNGTAWVNVFTMAYPSGYSKGVWYHQLVYVNESTYKFPTTMRLRFQCDALGDNCLVYIDQIYLNVTSYGRLECNFDLFPTSMLTPHSGSFSIGGTGDFDPEYALFNRTAIDISTYFNVKVSVWYSYKNTDSNDFLGLYYKNNSQWVPLFIVSNPQYSGQKPWTQVIVDIPQTLSSLVLQFKWRSTSASEYLAIDDLEITGIPRGGENNFTGIIDEVKIFPRELTPEQLYQNYLCTKDGNSSRSVLISEEIRVDETWKCFVTPNNGVQDDVTTESNPLMIINYGGGG